MSFYTVINCMDGRVQIPVINFLKQKFNVEYVDSITEAGPNLILSENKDINKIESIFKKIEISVKKHGSVGIAIVGHYDCAGNPVSHDEQVIHIKKAIELVKTKYESLDVIGLWVDEKFVVKEVV